MRPALSSLAAALAACLASPAAACITGTVPPRVSQEALAAAEQVVLVRVDTVERADFRCRLKAIVEAVEIGSYFSVGQAIETSMMCVDENVAISGLAGEWLFSDVPAAGQRGRLYYTGPSFTPPGPFYLNAKAVPPAAGGARFFPASWEPPRPLC